MAPQIQSQMAAAEIATVVVADEGVGTAADKTPSRDTTSDDIFDKFVGLIVYRPMLIIAITVSITFAISLITSLAIYENSAIIFPEDRNDIRSLRFDAISQAKAGLWPNTDDGCNGGERQGGVRRRLRDGTQLGQSHAALHTSMFKPVVMQTIGKLDRGATMLSPGYNQPPPDRPPTGPVPRFDAKAEKFVWDEHSASRRRLDEVQDEEEAGASSCEGDEVALSTEDTDTVWDYSRCDPFATAAPKTVAGSAGTGSTGLGCNKLCDPEVDRECTATQSEGAHFFIMVFEAVSGSNSYYQGVDDKDPYGLGPGNMFSPENLEELKRMESIILDDPEYRTFCHVIEGADGVGRCAGMNSVLKFFQPRDLPSTADMMAEVERKFVPENPTSLLPTDLGCSLQWFMYELYNVRLPCASSVLHNLVTNC
eukprot:SAG11_NODE_5011_length_1692_cov_2.064030_1_plen_424_part_00